MENETSTQRFIVDFSADTGAIRHGATGFLYGLGQDGIPSVNMLAALKPQVAVQKPEGGLQHPKASANLASRNVYAAEYAEISGNAKIVYPLSFIMQGFDRLQAGRP